MEFPVPRWLGFPALPPVIAWSAWARTAAAGGGAALLWLMVAWALDWFG